MAKKPSKQVSVIEVSASVEIAEIQLERLKAISRERLLSYEETKIFDLLHKNLQLAKGDPTSVVTTSRVVEDKKIDSKEKAELIEIATKIEHKDLSKILNFVEASDGDPKEDPK